ncbi:nucleoside hydrolase [uncultured Formosa sp.]|uniref:nucleoside hydrolase n=1 Tax=uncultured Formosa sp. TaxID=255435 RepID=UPI002632E880|nr:nucleoside hydrolase [uncultured Formosa sp.]
MFKKLLKFSACCVIALMIQTSKAQSDYQKIPVIIDADTANEVDDLFAIVRAVGEPKFNVLGITSAQFHTSPYASDSTVVESQRINERLMALMGSTDIPLPLGSNNALTAPNTPQDSEAARFIIEKAHQLKADQTLQLVILGSCTNVVSAILLDETIIPKIQVNYLGFWHDPQENTYNKKEFNSGNDTIAVNVLLNHPTLNLRVMTATTSLHLVFKKTTVDMQLKGKGDMPEYLVNRWETYNRWWTKKDPEKTAWIMWDVAIIEALIHPEWTTLETFKTPKENTQRDIKIYTKIDVDNMEHDFWRHLNKLMN